MTKLLFGEEVDEKLTHVMDGVLQLYFGFLSLTVNILTFTLYLICELNVFFIQLGEMQLFISSYLISGCNI